VARSVTTPPRDVSDVALPLATPITARPVQTAPVCKIRATRRNATRSLFSWAVSFSSSTRMKNSIKIRRAGAASNWRQSV